MKRAELVRHLTSHGCELFREGGRHSIYWNPSNRKTTAVPVIRTSSLPWLTGYARILVFPGQVSRAAAPANKGMKQTKPEHNGASQLILGVRRTVLGAREATLPASV